MSLLAQLKQRDDKATIFTLAEIQSLLGFQDPKALYNATSYAVKTGQLFKITEGIFAITKDYSREEFANKYRRPSYISLYTVLSEAGVIFQPYDAIYVIAQRTEQKEIDGQTYIYRKLKDEALLNPTGLFVDENKNIVKATPERAICDKIYLDGLEYFDNLRSLDWDLMKEINTVVFDDNKQISKFIKLNNEGTANTKA